MESESPLTEAQTTEEGWTHNAAPQRTAGPTHNRLSYSGPLFQRITKWQLSYRALSLHQWLGQGASHLDIKHLQTLDIEIMSDEHTHTCAHTYNNYNTYTSSTPSLQMQYRFLVLFFLTHAFHQTYFPQSHSSLSLTCSDAQTRVNPRPTCTLVLNLKMGRRTLAHVVWTSTVPSVHPE